MKTRRTALCRVQRGGLMVEVLVSLLLLSVSILGLVRVLGTSLQDSGDLQYRSEAATLADDVIGRMWVDRTNFAAYETGCEEDEEGEGWEDLPRLPNGARRICVEDDVVTVSIRWQAPSAPSPSQYEVSATLMTNDDATAPPPPGP